MNRPVRLFIAAHSGQQGGAELCLDTLLEYLPREKYSIEICFACDGPMVQAARERGYRTVVEPLSWWLGFENSFWYWRNLARFPFRVARLSYLLRKGGFDLVLSNSSVIFEGALAAKRSGINHIWYVHEILSNTFWKGLLPIKTICNLVSRWSEHVIFESLAAQRVFVNQLHGREETRARLHAVPNPVRFASEVMDQTSKEHAKGALRLRQEDFVILWIGQFIQRKNPFLALKAFWEANLPLGATLVMVGDGPLREEMKRACVELSQSKSHKRVEILPFQDDVRTFYAAADVLLLTSLEESFGLVLVEAGAFGLPCIATRSGGPEEIIRDGITGFLVGVNDVKATATYLELLAQNRELCCNLGQKAREFVSRHYSPKNYAAKLDQIIQQTCRR